MYFVELGRMCCMAYGKGIYSRYFWITCFVLFLFGNFSAIDIYSSYAVKWFPISFLIGESTYFDYFVVVVVGQEQRFYILSMHYSIIRCIACTELCYTCFTFIIAKGHRTDVGCCWPARANCRRRQLDGFILVGKFWERKLISAMIFFRSDLITIS